MSAGRLVNREHCCRQLTCLEMNVDDDHDHHHGNHQNHGDHGDVDHGDDNAMAMKPVGGLGEVVRSRSQPPQNYHLAARHAPPKKMFFL